MSAFSRYPDIKEPLYSMFKADSTMTEVCAELGISRTMVLNYRLRLMDDKHEFIDLPSDEEGKASVVVSDHKQININRSIVDMLTLPVVAKDRLAIKCEVNEEGYVITLTCAKKMKVASDRSAEVAAA